MYNTSYYSTYGYPSGYSNADAIVASSAILSALMVYLVIILAVYIVQIIAMWKIFTKAGEKGWKSIIPIYNVVILFKISGLSPWLVLAFLAVIIPFIGWLVPVALNAILSYKLAKAFNKDGGWAVGLYFLAPVFYMILAFGSSEYVGSSNETTSTENSTPITPVNENTDDSNN